MRAAVLRGVNESVQVEDGVTTRDPGPNEVRVRMAASGVCHSDLSAQNGTVPAMMPMVLGHEGAGVVTQVGENVTSLTEGDHVVIAVSAPCGACADCIGGSPALCTVLSMPAMMEPRFQLGEETLYGMVGLGTFCDEMVVPVHALIPIPKDVPLEVAALLGCGVLTGVGAAMNAARVEPGSTVVVFGCGGVGMSVIQGARICGASTIVAVDLSDEKLDLARRFGATHGVHPDEVGSVIADLTAGRGFDYGFEVVGRAEVMRAAFDATRRGGTTVVVGVGAMEDFLALSAMEIAFSEKNLRGSIMGSADVRRDVPRLIELWRAGRLDLEGLITHRIDLADVGAGLANMGRPDVVRSVVIH